MKCLWVVLASLACLATRAAAPASGSEYGSRIINPPVALAVGQRVALYVRYLAPAAPTPLHIQLQTHVGWIVIANVTKQVSGGGALNVDVVVPPDAVGQEVRFGTWLGTKWQHPLGPTYFTPFVHVLTTAQGVQMAANAKIQAVFLARYGGSPNNRGLVGTYQIENPQSTTPKSGGWPQTIEMGLAKHLRAAGFTVCRLTSRELTQRAIVNPCILPTLIVVDIAAVPSAAIPVIGQYAASGGHLVALGGPAFSSAQFRLHGTWIDRAQFLPLARRNLVVHPLALPKATDQWVQDSNVSRTLSDIQFLASAEGPAGARGAYRLNIDLNHWCTFRPRQPLAIPAADRVTVFWAKESEGARSLTWEWDERDGARWIATVQLHEHWTRYVLSEKDFVGWPHPAVPGRFFFGDHPHLNHVVSLKIGLVAPTSPPGRHAVYIAGVGTAAWPTGEATAVAAALQPRFAVPVIEAVSPAYKLFRVTDMKTLTTTTSCPVVLAPVSSLPTPHRTLGVIARAQATGLDKRRAERYLPLLACRDAKGRFVAAAAALVLPATEAKQPQTIFSVPVTDPNFFASTATQHWLVTVIRWMNHGLYLAEGGTKWNACFAGATTPIGAVVENRGPTPQPVRVISTVTNAAGNIVFQHAFTGTVSPGRSQTFTASWTPPAPRGWESIYYVTTVLRTAPSRKPGAPNAAALALNATAATSVTTPAGTALDRLAQQFRVLGANPHPHFVTVRDGEFYLDGQRWYPFGVNYMPSSGIGQESWDLWENFFSRYDYAPAAVQRDLEDIKAMGFNMISTLVHVNNHDEMTNGNVLDLLARCKELGLRVNLALAGDSPMHFNWKLDKRWIQTLRLAHNATVFAYDIDWEAHWGNQVMRRQYDPLWRQWILAHYGSIAKAEALWHCRIPRRRGQITNPTNRQFDSETPAHAMVIAYRRFLNELLERRYGRARQLIHSIAPHQLVSFRMSYAGGVNPRMGAWTPYDLYGFSHALDFFAPEGYALIALNRASLIRRGLFTLAYARACNPAMPIIYAEFGASVFDQAISRDSPGLENIVARQYTNFYRMLLRGGANGAVCWFFPGGYRVNEQSDCGVINPDRSWRPVSYVIHRFAPQFETPHPKPKPNAVIPVVRSQYEGGAPEMYAHIAIRWKQIVKVGQLPGLRFARPTSALSHAAARTAAP